MKYLSDSDTSQTLNNVWNPFHNIEDLRCQLGCTNITLAHRHHCDFLGLCQWSSYLRSHLRNITSTFISNSAQLEIINVKKTSGLKICT